MILNETQIAVRETVRAFARERLAPNSRAFEQASGYPDGLFEELGGRSLMGMTAPEEFGGAAMDYISYAVALMELAGGDGALSTIVSIQNRFSCPACSMMAARIRRRVSCPTL